MTALYCLLEQVVFFFASWTFSYHAILALRLPAILVLVPAIALYVLTAVTFGTSLRRALHSARAEPAFVTCLILLGLLCALLTLHVYKTDGNDVEVFHRALVAVDDAYAPFPLEQTAYDVTGLHPASLSDVLTSYEPFAALVGKGLTGNALWFYHNFTAAFAAFLAPAAFALAFRFFRLGSAPSVVAAVLTAGFLLLDGGVDRSFGNEGFVRLWRGNALLITVGLPFVLLTSLRFLAKPSSRRFAVVFCAAVSAAGLAGAGLFLAPLAVFAASAAYVLSFGLRRGRAGKAMVLNLASVYCAAVSGLSAAGAFGGVSVMPVGQDSWASGWLDGLMLVLGSPRMMVRDAIVLLIVPAALGALLVRRYLVLLALVLAGLFANPVAGPPMMRLVGPGAYFNLCYLLPIPLFFGLVVSGFTTRRLSSASLIRMIVSVATVLSLFWSLRATTVHGAHEKASSGLKLAPREYAFVNAASGHIGRGCVVLAPEEIVSVLALVRPDTRFVATRQFETMRAFRRAGEAAEGRARAAAQNALSDENPSAESGPALGALFGGRVDCVIVRSPSYPAVRPLLEEQGIAHVVAEADNWYTLVLLDRPSPASFDTR